MIEQEIARLTEPRAEWGDLQRYLQDRRRQLQDWEARPPHRIGGAVLAAVALEWPIAQKLLSGESLGISVLGTWIGTGLWLAALTGSLAWATHWLVQRFGKEGKWAATFSFFNVGLAPMLLYLPIALFCWALGWTNAPPLFALFLLGCVVLSNWKESLEIVYELTRWQSGLVIAGFLWIGGMLISVVVTLGFIGLLAQMLSLFS